MGGAVTTWLVAAFDAGPRGLGSSAGQEYCVLYNNQINARALIGQSAVVYCASKPMEKSRIF